MSLWCPRARSGSSDAKQQNKQCSAVDKNNKTGRRLHQCDGVHTVEPWSCPASAGRHQQEVRSKGRLHLERRYDCIMLVLHWICLLSGFGSSGENGSWLKVSWGRNGNQIIPDAIPYSIWTLLRAWRCWRKSQCSFYMQHVGCVSTLDERNLKSRQMNRAAFLCTASILVTLRLTYGHPTEAQSAWGLTKVL